MPLYATAGFWVVLLLPVAALGGAAAVRRHRDRIEGDVAYARVRRAGRMARKRLARARSLASGDPRAFHAEVAGALEGLLADKLNVAEAGLVREEAGRLAAERGVSSGDPGAALRVSRRMRQGALRSSGGRARGAGAGSGAGGGA